MDDPIFLNTVLAISGIIVSIAALLLAIFTLKLARKWQDDLDTTLMRHKSALHDIVIRIETATESLSGEIIRSRHALFDPVTMEIYDKLRDNTRLTERLMNYSQKEKLKLSEVFTRVPLNGFCFFEHILNECENRSIFMESGSTLAYLALGICQESIARDRGPIFVTTNNVLIQHLFVFEPNISVELLQGTPAGQYGATFGDKVPWSEPVGLPRLYSEMNFSIDNRPTNEIGDLRQLDFYIGTESQRKAMGSDFEQFLKDHHMPDLIVMTTSQLSLENGPHVGSFQNLDFKKILLNYSESIPLLMVIVEDKIHEGIIDDQKCLRIFPNFNAFHSKISSGNLSLLVTCSRPLVAGEVEQSHSEKLIMRFKEVVSYGDVESKKDLIIHQTSDRAKFGDDHLVVITARDSKVDEICRKAGLSREDL